MCPHIHTYTPTYICCAKTKQQVVRHIQPYTSTHVAQRCTHEFHETSHPTQTIQKLYKKGNTHKIAPQNPFNHPRFIGRPRRWRLSTAFMPQIALFVKHFVHFSVSASPLPAVHIPQLANHDEDAPASLAWSRSPHSHTIYLTYIHIEHILSYSARTRAHTHQHAPCNFMIYGQSCDFLLGM